MEIPLSRSHLFLLLDRYWLLGRASLDGHVDLGAGARLSWAELVLICGRGRKRGEGNLDFF